MLNKPGLKSFLTVFPISETTWGLRGGGDELWRLELGHHEAMRTFTALLPYLDGRHPTEGILAELAERGVASAAARRVLEQLERAGLIEDADDAELSAREIGAFREQISLFSRFTSQGGARYQKALRESRVALCGDGTLAGRLERQLAEAGIGTVVRLVANGGKSEGAGSGDGLTEVETRTLDRGSIWPAREAPPDLLIVSQQSYEPELLEAVDALSERRRLPWMLVRSLDLREGWVGPLFIPGETAGYPSLEARLRGNLPYYDEHLAFDRRVRASGEPVAGVGGLHAFFELLAGIAVIEAVKLLSGVRPPDLAGRFVTVDPWSWELELHEVLKVPWVDHGLGAPVTPYPWKVESGDADGAD